MLCCAPFLLLHIISSFYTQMCNVQQSPQHRKDLNWGVGLIGWSFGRSVVLVVTFLLGWFSFPAGHCLRTKAHHERMQFTRMWVYGCFGLCLCFICFKNTHFTYLRIAFQVYTIFPPTKHLPLPQTHHQPITRPLLRSAQRLRHYPFGEHHFSWGVLFRVDGVRSLLNVVCLLLLLGVFGFSLRFDCVFYTAKMKQVKRYSGGHQLLLAIITDYMRSNINC